MGKHTYAVGSKKGPVMFDGTVFKSQKELNKNFLIGLVVVAILLFFIFKSSSSSVSSGPYTIEISGTSGIGFSGSVGGGSTSRTVDGTVPTTYTVYGWPAVAVIQNTKDYGTITVTIKENGETIKTETTRASYGIVTVSSP